MQKNKTTLIIIIALVVIAIIGYGIWAINKKAPQTATPQTTTNMPEQTKKEVVRILPGQEDLCQKYSKAAMKTNLGEIEITFYCNESPMTVNNFMNLAKNGLYKDTKFHRIIKDFMIQGGDFNSKDNDLSNDGMGGPGYKFDDEFNDHKLVKGSLAMANAGPNTNGSQFFIVTAEATPWLDGHHTNFGYVSSGMDVVDKIGKSETYTQADNMSSIQKPQDHPKQEVVVEGIELK
jgi:cyclophilin family peptidyl-prolyl cis-trans isomerase